MEPFTKIVMKESFQSVDIEEPGYYKTVGYNELSGSPLRANSVVSKLIDVEYDYRMKRYQLAHSVSYSGAMTDFTDPKSKLILSQKSGYVNSSQFTYPTGASADFPAEITSKASFIKDDASFVIELQKHCNVTYGSGNYTFIAIKCLSPTIIKGDYEFDTIVLVFPNSQTKAKPFWVFAQWESINGKPEIFKNSLENIEGVDSNIQYIGDQPTFTDRWINSMVPVSIYFRRIDDELVIYSDAFGADEIHINSGDGFATKNVQIKIGCTERTPFSFRIGEMSFKTSGKIALEIPLGYVATTVPEVSYYVDYLDSDEDSDITIDELTVEGMYCYCTLQFTSSNSKYTPSVKRISIVVPANFTRNEPTADEYNFTSEIINWSINKNVNAAPTATFNLSNNKMLYNYDYLNSLIGMQVRIFAGYNEDNLWARFTGIITDIDINRESPSSCTVSFKAKGLSCRLDVSSLIEREYDGSYHMDAVADICSIARLANIVTEDPIDDFDLLGYGKEKCKYKLEIGDTFRNLINKIIEFSGFVIDEDEMGCIVYANDKWRDYGVNSYTTYGEGVLWNTNLGISKTLITSSDISGISLNVTHENLRNSVVVIGVADKYIPEDPNGFYPSYSRGDYIIAIRDDQRLVSLMGHKYPMVVRKPEYNTPEACIYTAEKLLDILIEAQVMASIKVLGDTGLFIGMTCMIIDENLFGPSVTKYIRVESINETFSNGMYLISLEGRLVDFPPVM